jgi:hypothetical protein
MKDAEDEAFDELAKKQGSWGGGFPAKRRMAADKLQEPVTHLWECLGRWSAYLVENGKQADCAPPSWLVDAINKATTSAQPAQDVDYWIREATAARQAEMAMRRELEAQPAQREWVGLTAEDFSAIKFPVEMRFPAEFRAGARWADTKLKEKNA